MCKFFSCCSDGKGKLFYFAWEDRKAKLEGDLKLKDYEMDSHTSIADFYGYKGSREDKLNKYEYNPLTKEFKIDQINTSDDSDSVKKQLDEMDWEKIVKPLIIKPIIHPFKDFDRTKVTEKEIELLKEWDSVCASVRDSVRDSVSDSVWYSVWDSVRDSVSDSVWYSVWVSVRDSVWDSVWYSVWSSAGDSVWDSVRYSVWDSVRVSVRASVRASVRDSVWASVWGYVGSFFEIWNGDYKFQSAVKLWEAGLVPSYDGEIWRLHGADGKIVYEEKRAE